MSDQIPSVPGRKTQSVGHSAIDADILKTSLDAVSALRSRHQCDPGNISYTDDSGFAAKMTDLSGALVGVRDETCWKVVSRV